MVIGGRAEATFLSWKLFLYLRNVFPYSLTILSRIIFYLQFTGCCFVTFSKKNRYARDFIITRNFEYINVFLSYYLWTIAQDQQCTHWSTGVKDPQIKLWWSYFKFGFYLVAGTDRQHHRQEPLSFWENPSVAWILSWFFTLPDQKYHF